MKLTHKIQILKKAEPGSFSKWIKIVISFLFLINISSCNSPEDPGQENFINTPFVNHFETGTTSGTISFDFGENLKYQVVLAPKWINIKAIQGQIENGKLNIPFEFNNIQDYMGQENYISGALIIRIGYIGLFSFAVSYGTNQGTDNPDPDPDPDQPPLICSVAYLHFESENNLSFTLTNPGIYGNSWQADDIPSWLQLSEGSGYIPGGNQVTIQCYINREGLFPGDYSQIISIQSTNPILSSGILVTMKIDNVGPVTNLAKIKWMTGKVKDSYFCKTTDYMYVLTQNPNQLLYKLPDNDSLYTLPLSKVPNCIDVSEDGKTLAIGYNQAVVDLFDAQSFEIKRSYDTDCIPFDIVIGENDWCYITPDLDQWAYIYSLNLNTGVTFRSGSFVSIYEKTIIVKDPVKPLLYATRPQLSPEGVLIINIEDGVARDSIPSWHVSTGSALWTSPDGKKLITGDKKIFKTPEYTTQLYNLNLPVIGSIEIPRGYIKNLDYCELLNCYFVVGSDYVWTSFNGETIYQLDAGSYSVTKSVKVQTYPGYLSYMYNPPMNVHHLFSNKQGTKIFALKNVPYDMEMDKWALEIIDLPLN